MAPPRDWRPALEGREYGDQPLTGKPEIKSGDSDSAHAQAREVFVLWTSRRVAEPDSLRARASTVATISTAAAAGALVTLVGRADDASGIAFALMGLSLLCFVLSVGAALRAITRPFEYAPQSGLSSIDLIRAVAKASSNECATIRPWLTRANYLSVAAIALALLSLLLVVAAPEELPKPTVSVNLTAQGESSADALCGRRASEFSGTLDRWDSAGVVLSRVTAPCKLTKVWLPARSVSAVRDR